MGASVADTLLGVSCPAGRLPMSWPRRFEDSCAAKSVQLARGGENKTQSEREGTTLLGSPTVRIGGAAALPGETVYAEGLRVGYRAYGEGGVLGSISPLFPFGHGLSYTTFGY